MKAYFEYVSENEKSFLRFRLAMIFTVIISSILVWAIFYGHHELDDFSKQEGVVSSVHLNTIEVEASGAFGTRWTVEKEVVDIILNQNRFIVRYELDDYKERVFKKIKKGDYVHLYYSSIDGHLELKEIDKDGDLILEYAGREQRMALFFISIPSILLGSILLLIWVTRMRKKYLSIS